ncbi:hypothetical protein TNCV_105731 [Trichonephila clavipes]|nr:hypothetical protein TNCV_105731 [Trichonephila clavipes]
MSSGLEEELGPASESPGGRTLSSVRGMSSFRYVELCPASGLPPVAWMKKSVLRQRYLYCPGSRTGSRVRDISKDPEWPRSLRVSPSLGKYGCHNPEVPVGDPSTGAKMWKKLQK